ncbi:MAG TPA: amidohydrolase family protein [Gammaproteobacteria bacterium]
MNASRRSFLKLAGALGATLAAGRAAGQARMQRRMPNVGPAPYKRIAAEEAWGTAELFREWKRVLDAKPADELGFVALWRNLDPTGNTGFTARLMDLGENRLAAMDAAGIDMQILMLTAPGVQVFDAETGTALARDTNDQLAEACRNHPDRYAGCVAIAPQDPRRAALEIERGIQRLGLKGVIVNSHTKGEYLAEPKYWEIFEAAEANDVPIYIHPREPSPEMVKPFIDYDLLRGDLGFGVEVAFHTQAIINAGVFDRFPNAKLVIGHGGEGIPYNLYRLDRTHPVRRPDQRAKEPPSYYMRRNVYITNSGVAWAPMVLFAQQVLGVDRVLYAMDYPYQYDIEEVHAMDALPISYEDKKKFFQTNAERVFNLTRAS